MSIAALARAIATALIVFSLAGAAQAQQTAPIATAASGWQKLTAAQIRTIVATYPIAGINKWGKPYIMRYKANGRATGVGNQENPDGNVTGWAVSNYDDNKISSDTGVWWIEDRPNRLCLKMYEWNAGAVTCWGLSVSGSEYRYSNEAGNTTLQVYLGGGVPYQGRIWSGQ